MPTLHVEPMVLESLNYQSRLLWGLEGHGGMHGEQ